MANNLSMTVSTSIQIADQSLPPNSPSIYSRNPLLSSVLFTNMQEQVINLTALFTIPLSGTGVYSFFYVRNLMPASSNTILLLGVTIGGSGISFQLAPGAYIFLGSPIQGNFIPITASNLSAFSNAYPLLAEYAVGATTAI